MHGSVTIAINALIDLSTLCGSKVYLLELARELAQLPKVNLRLIVASDNKQLLPNDLCAYAIELPVARGRSHRQFTFQRRIRRALRDLKADVWHLPNTMPARPQPAATVITIHDLADLRLRKYGRVRTLYRRFANTTGARMAERVLTVSEHSKRDIVSLLKMPADKVVVVYPGVSEIFRPLSKSDCQDDLRERYSISAPFILAPGGILPNKNISRLIVAFALRRDTSQLLVLTGAFDASIGRSIQQQIFELGLQGKVLLTGHVPTGDMPRFYSACDAVAYVSLYEGFGLPLLEAMACGAPVVTSTTSSLPEVAGDAALLVDPYDTHAIAQGLERVLTDQSLRQKLIEHGHKRAKDFTWRRTALETLSVYLQAAELYTSKHSRATTVSSTRRYSRIEQSSVQ